jgi:hypothetical protein
MRCSTSLKKAATGRLPAASVPSRDAARPCITAQQGCQGGTAFRPVAVIPMPSRAAPASRLTAGISSEMSLRDHGQPSPPRGATVSVLRLPFMMIAAPRDAAAPLR